MEKQILNQTGQPVAKLNLTNPLWSLTPHKQAMFDAIVSQQTNAPLRYGKKRVKNRAAVSGGGAKPWRQKGTGRARQGSIRSPQWRGGGVVFGPNPAENFAKKVNKKVYRLAMRSLLAEKVQQNELMVLDKLELPTISTKALAALLETLSIQNKKTLIIVTKLTEALVHSSANLKKVYVTQANNLSARVLANNNQLLVTQAALQQIEEIYQ